MNNKYQIFISSTFVDLIDQREQVLKTILKMGHLPVGMEMFNAADQSQWEVIKRHIDNSDYYIVVIAHRYGSVDKDGIGFTEKEYDYAKSKGIPCLAFVIDDSVNWPPKYVETGPGKKSLQKFKQKVKGTLVNQWDTTDKLAFHVLSSLTEAITISPGRGWVRADEGAASPQVLEELSRLSKENNQLKSALAAASKKTNETVAPGDVLASQKVLLKGTDKEISYLDIFASLGHIMAIPRSAYAIRSEGEHLINRLGAVADNSFDQDVITPLLDILYILDLATKSYESYTGSYQYSLTSKGKALLAKVKFSSQ